MPNKPAAAKYYRASLRRRLRNRPVRTRARTAVRDAIDAIDSADWDDAEQLIPIAVRALDRAAQRRVIHPNNAARHKARLLRRYQAARDPQRRARPRIRPPPPVEVP